METLEPHAAFAKLADETRIDILRAVATAEREADSLAGAPVLSFSELYDRVDVSNSSRFAYHLEQLTGTFLRKTEDGYTFTYAGERVVRTILSGAYNESVTIDPVGVGGECPSCGEPTLEARQESVELRIRCVDCGQGVASYPLTPGLVANREPSAVVDAVAERIRAASFHLIDGNCQECGGPIDGEVRETDVVSGDPFLYVGRCTECWSTYAMPLSTWAITHPATVSFYWERGLDVRTLPFWELVPYLVDGRWRVERPSDDSAADGTAYRITIRDAADELRFELDADLTVTRVRRVTEVEG